MINTLFLDDIINDAISSMYTITYPRNKDVSRKYYVKKEKENIVFSSEAMGLSKDDISMYIKNKHLFVKSKQKSGDGFSSSIDCNVYIGEDIVPEETTAKLDSGVLTIKVPTKESKLDHQISFA